MKYNQILICLYNKCKLRYLYGCETTLRIMLSGSIRRITNNSRLYSTVNKHEVDFFSKLSKHWWDESGEFGLLHKMNPVRAEFILKNINNARREDAIRSNRQFEDVNTLSGLTALDIGCGGGLLSEVEY